MKLSYPEWRDCGATAQRIPSKFWNIHQQNYQQPYPTYKTNVMRMTMSTGSTMSSRVHRKVIRIPSKRYPGKMLPGKLNSMSRGKIYPGKMIPGKRIPAARPAAPTYCDNSNDSGLGFEHNPDTTNSPQLFHSSNVGGVQQSATTTTTSNSSNASDTPQNMSSGIRQLSSVPSSSRKSIASISNDSVRKATRNREPSKPSKPTKRVKIEPSNNVESDPLDALEMALAFDENDEPSVATKAKSNRAKVSAPIARPVRRVGGPTVTPMQPGTVTSRDGKYQLQILAQPEQQHRARYQTEGSRGAVKDRSGNGFPIVKLIGYKKPAVLEIFIGTDIGRVAPHMFYQACKVSGKNSTHCVEKKLEGTIVIEIDLKPETDMTVTCDCVGILKERNVDVEHRFPDQMAPRSKKKSTRCRMVFRTQLELDDGTTETLQMCSQQIICTQPPGVPEICKKSLTSCPADGGLELYILGKNFLKDTRVIFQARRNASPHHTTDEYDIVWEEAVVPDKEYLQQTHLCCIVPPYVSLDIIEPVAVQLLVISSDKRSESHTFMYTPCGAHSLLTAATTRGVGSPATTTGSSSSSHYSTLSPQVGGSGVQDLRFSDVVPTVQCPPTMIWNPALSQSSPVTGDEIDSGMMPPPTHMPLNVRRSSSSGLICGVDPQLAVSIMKAELLDENSQGSQDNNNMIGINSDGLDHMSAAVGCSDSPMDGSQPKDICYSGGQQQQTTQQRRIYRKHSIDMMDSDSDGLILAGVQMPRNGSNSMNAFDSMLQIDQSAADMKGVDLRIKQEQQNINLAAQIQQLKNEAHLLSAVQAQVSREQSVNKFLLDVAADAQHQRQQVVDSVTVALFANQQINPVATSVTPQDVIFNAELNHLNQQINNVNKTTSAIEQSILAHNMMVTEPSAPEANAAMAHMLGFTTAAQPMNMMNSNSASPLSSQDIILNSTPSLNSPLSILTGNPMGTVSSDIILNPTVSPSMMCTNSSDNGNVIMPSVQVSSVRSCHQPMNQQQSPQEPLLNGLIVPDPIHIPRSPVAVKNMILNAAADILSSTPSTISPETTISALISLNSSPLINTNPQQQQQQQQSANDVSQLLMTAQSPTTVDSLMQQQQNTIDTLGQLQQQQQQSLFGDSLAQQLAVANILPTNTAQQQALLNNMANMNVGAVTRQQQQQHQMQEFINDIQKIHQITTNGMQQHPMDTSATQSSLLQAVALVPKGMQQIQQSNTLSEVLQHQRQHQHQQLQHQQQQLQQQQQQQPISTTTANIPQDIAIMSDNDLISYINPSCFDQV